MLREKRRRRPLQLVLAVFVAVAVRRPSGADGKRVRLWFGCAVQHDKQLITNYVKW